MAGILVLFTRLHAAIDAFVWYFWCCHCFCCTSQMYLISCYCSLLTTNSDICCHSYSLSTFTPFRFHTHTYPHIRIHPHTHIHSIKIHLNWNYMSVICTIFIFAMGHCQCMYGSRWTTCAFIVTIFVWECGAFRMCMVDLKLL